MMCAAIDNYTVRLAYSRLLSAGADPARGSSPAAAQQPKVSISWYNQLTNWIAGSTKFKYIYIYLLIILSINAKRMVGVGSRLLLKLLSHGGLEHTFRGFITTFEIAAPGPCPQWPHSIIAAIPYGT